MSRATTTQSSVLAEPSRVYRAPVARGVKEGVDREGGLYGAGVIRGASVIARGEALGHYEWVDDVMLQQVADAIAEKEMGVKGRFAHPDMSGDGLGKALGRWTNGRVDGDRTRADLNFYSTAHDTPDGDLAGYIMRLADEDPEAFGASIAFDADIGEMDRFRAENTDKDGVFKSPDKDNSGNLLHVRLAELRAADMVDEPASNPDGLFHRGDELVCDADALMAYVFGHEGPKVAGKMFGMHPERVREFVGRWMSRNGYRIVNYRKIREREREVELART